ncbi:15-hydroxyprostaglandin dehydrogenase [NAD(+)] [Plakobranchus ocellatus]|uniref:15-hydroxyprostaglandin dehydrogenase [NAD(+)] n=1 Tax=Plakobranchus ocellatus TaxID=259542 RepID=A0AAV4D773_9GAST|nr:15-hydroxyprostaglandin dehydrogenase [NAD(+)] [Plakobranchus ocellatus]
MTMSMAGQTAFITGGAMGIGRAFTETLLAEGAEKVACVRGSKLAMEHMNKKNGGRGGRIINTSPGLASRLHPDTLCTLSKQNPTATCTGGGLVLRQYTMNFDRLHPDRELTGVQFASICPTAVKTDFLKKIDERTVFYVDTFKGGSNNISITPSQEAEGFLKLLRMPHMNGAILKVGRNETEFCKLEYVGLGSDWTPPP